MDIPDNELQWTFARSGGPGGQNVNKVSSKAILRWDVAHTQVLPDAVRERLMQQQKNHITTEGELLVASQRYRDQEANRQDCLAKLQAMIAKATHVPKPRRPTRATKASIERRLEQKQRRAAVKDARRKPLSE